MTDLEALYASVLAAPNDDTLRLAFADFLDDHGNRDRAAFIRAGIALALLPKRPANHHELCKENHPYAGCAYCEWWIQTGEAYKTERAKVAEIFLTHSGVWWGDENPNPLPSVGGLGWALETDSHDLVIRERKRERYFFRRGFLDEVRCEAHWWAGGYCRQCSGVGDDGGRLEVSTVCRTCGGSGDLKGFAAEICGAHPVTRVYFTDKRPTEWSAGVDGDKREWVWERCMSDQSDPEEFYYLGTGPFRPLNADPEDSVLPSELFDLMDGEPGGTYLVIGKHSCRRYATYQDALDDLSLGAIRLGRRRADEARLRAQINKEKDLT